MDKTPPLPEAIKALAAWLPEPEFRPKTHFEITRVSLDEVRFSQWLGYFLQPDEDHGLGTLFFDALLDVLGENEEMETNQSSWQGDFSVAVEQNHLDLLIYEVESRWAIIIEHKIRADLYNDLESYWNRIQAPKKLGVVLAPKNLQQAIVDKNLPEPISFTAITHREWADAIQARLEEVAETIENRTAVYVNDLLENINQFYQYMEPQPQPESTAATLWQHANQLRKIKDAETGIFKYLEKQLKKRLEDYDYVTNSSGKSGWHFYPKEEIDKEVTGLRFWVGVDGMTTNPVLPIFVELYNKAADNKPLVAYLRNRMEMLLGEVSWPGRVTLGTGRRHNWAHLLVFEGLDLPEAVTPDVAFSAQLEGRLFQKLDSLNGLHILDFLRQEIKRFLAEQNR